MAGSVPALRSRATSFAREALKATSGLADQLRPPEVGSTILIYHRVGSGDGSQMDLDPETFAKQMAWLAGTQRVISLDHACSELEHDDPVEPSVVLTFDDGTSDWIRSVLPVLVLHDLPATFYVCSGFVTGEEELPSNGRAIGWAELAELAASPLVTIGSHTHRHRLLDRLDPTELADELDRPTALIEDHLGVSPSHFAYPKAVAPSPAAAAEVRRRFRSATLAGTRSNTAPADLHRLARTPIQPSDGERWFRRKVAGGLHLEDDLRQRANRLRYRNAKM